MTDVKKFNNQTLGEEIANAISHGVGSLLAIAGTAVLIVHACYVSDAIGIVSAAIYGFTMIMLFTMSTLYHSFTNQKAKRVFQVFDHCSIFLLIVGTYIPISLAMIRGPLGWTLFGIEAALGVLGIVLNSLSVAKWHKLSLVMYLLMGWCVIIAIFPVAKILGTDLFAWSLILGGGVTYTVGIIFYRAKRPRFMHSIWHLFVIAAAALFYFFTYIYVLPLR